MRVWTDEVFSSYLAHPAVNWSVDKEVINLFPALSAEFVILDRAVNATTCKAENFTWTDSTPFSSFDISTLPADLFSCSRLLDDSSNFKLFFNLSIVPSEVFTFLSKRLLSNSIETILWSTVVLIIH